MDNVARKKLRELTGKLRQILESDFKNRDTRQEGIREKAWRWAIHLAVKQAMQARSIDGEVPSFLTVACRPGDEPSPGVLQCCRDLLAPREADQNPFAAADALGWMHQYWHDSERQVIAANSGGDPYSKITAAEMVSATQVYTERYIVDFLLQNSLGAYWLGMYPDSGLAGRWQYFVKRAAVDSFPAKSASELTVIDPACGCGNFLLAAFDLLYDMYSEDARGKSPEAICASILNHNLFGVDIDAEAVEITGAVLWLKAKEKAPGLLSEDLTSFVSHIAAAGASATLPNARELGALLQPDQKPAGEDQLSAVLGRRYDVVVTNPPYVDKRDYAESVRSYLRRHYQAGAGNLYTAFILRCLDLADRFVGMITPQTFLFLTSYTSLRQAVFRGASIRTLAHLGLGTFEDAVVDTAMFVLTKRSFGQVDSSEGGYFKLLEEPQKKAALLAAIAADGQASLPANVFYRTLEQVTALEGSPVTYWLGDEMLKVVQKSRPLRDYADIVLGMKTSDNKHFVRLWWEIDSEGTSGHPSGWAPYEKEASGYRFQRNSAHLVRWSEADLKFYKSHYSAQLPNPKYWFRPGLVYGLVSSKAFTAKLLPAGHMADMAASCIYPHDPADSFFLLGILNSKLYQWLLKMFNPTVNYQPIDLQRLPVPALAQGDKKTIGEQAVRAAEAIGKVREREITDRNYCFEPETFLPLGEKLSQLAHQVWLDSLEYLLARDAIDLQLAAALRLPHSEYRTIIAEMGGLTIEYPVIAGYDMRPETLTKDLLVCPVHYLRASSGELDIVKSKLKQLYCSDWTKGWSGGPADILEDWARKLKLHPLTVYHLINEGVSQEGWGGGVLGQRLGEDSFSAMVLWLIGHRWPKQLQSQCGKDRWVGIVPGGPGWGSKSMLELVREFVGGYCDAAVLEAEFGALVGVSLETWLADTFFKRHISQFKKRPVVWLLSSRPGRSSPVFSCFVHHRQAGKVYQQCTEWITPQLALRARQSDGEDSGRTAELKGFFARLDSLQQYDPDLDLGVRANIAPLQQAGILQAEVLSPIDAARADMDYRKWRESLFSQHEKQIHR